MFEERSRFLLSSTYVWRVFTSLCISFGELFSGLSRGNSCKEEQPIRAVSTVFYLQNPEGMLKVMKTRWSSRWSRCGTRMDRGLGANVPFQAFLQTSDWPTSAHIQKLYRHPLALSALDIPGLWLNLQQIYILIISNNVPLFSSGAWLASLSSWCGVALDFSCLCKDYFKIPLIGLISHWLITLSPYQIHCIGTVLFACRRVLCVCTATEKTMRQG